MAVEVTRYADTEAFVTVGEQFLARHEAENNLLLGMLGALREDATWLTDFTAYLGVGREASRSAGWRCGAPATG